MTTAQTSDDKAANPGSQETETTKTEVPAKAPPSSSSSVEKTTTTTTTAAARLEDDDDDTPAPGKEWTLSQAALDKRIARAKSSALKETFGTDDPAKIKQRLAKADELEKKQEESRRNQLDEQARLKEDIAKEPTLREAAEAKAPAAEERANYNEAHREVVDVAAPLIKKKFLKHAIADFREHLEELGDSKVTKLAEDYPAKWFASYVKENPEVSVASGTETTKTETTTKTKPLTTGGTREEKPAPGPSGTTQIKTFAPGKPNSMTKEEASAALATRGLRY